MPTMSSLATVAVNTDQIARSISDETVVCDAPALITRMDHRTTPIVAIRFGMYGSLRECNVPYSRMQLGFMHLVDYWVGIPLCLAVTMVERVRAALTVTPQTPPSRLLLIELSEMGS